MKRIFTLAVILLLNQQLSAQQFEWLRTPAINFSFNPEGIGYPTASDNQGNTFVCGFKDSPLIYNDIFGNLWLLKYNAAGELLFSRTITGTVNAYKMTVDTAGNLYIAAAYIDEISIDDLHITTSFQGVKPILLKFSSNGDLLWSKTIGGEFTEYFKALAVDSTGNVYIGYGDFLDTHIERLDSEGNSLTTINQTQVKSLSSVSVDSQGNIYAAGACAEMNVSFNGTDVVNLLPYNTYLVKYNPLGQMQWMHFEEDVTCPEPQVVARTPDEVYFSSYLNGSYTFGTIATEGPVGGGGTDFFLAKLNANGEYQWVKEVPGNGEVQLGNRNFLTIDNQGNPYIAARYRGTIQWSPSISSQSLNFNNDILVLKYNPQGDVLWAKTAGGTSEDRADGISILNDGSIILSGMAYGNVTFDALSHNTATDFTCYPYVTKINTSTLGIPAPELNNVTVYPNPAQDFITLNSPNYRGNAVIYSVLGQQLKKVNINTDTTAIDISTLASGTYLLRLETGQSSKIIKL
ncbi:MAG: T9SS type A sorting domain-containing protein [Flavobacterium sp.]|uniref:T9SS type A sorting domain-containing protein n=1 Tax=Flavobacterium sp. TaxID=239 RepID=UPI00326706BD